MQSQEVKFTLTKETKGTYKFDEEEVGGQPPVIGSLYVKKYWFNKRPTSVKIVLQADD